VDSDSQLLTLSEADDAVQVTTNGAKALAKLPAGITLGEGPVAGRKAMVFGKEASLEFPNVEYFSSDRPFSVAFVGLISLSVPETSPL
jgi:hypothetical protein